jgi:hypothetical protein
MKITWFGLIVHNTSPDDWGNVDALKGFPLSFSACRQLQQNHFAGPIIYYYEIKIMSTSKRDERQVCDFIWLYAGI